MRKYAIAVIIILTITGISVAASFPTVGGSEDTWGDELRAFFTPYFDLSTGLTVSGSIPNSALQPILDPTKLPQDISATASPTFNDLTVNGLTANTVSAPSILGTSIGGSSISANTVSATGAISGSSLSVSGAISAGTMSISSLSATTFNGTNAVFSGSLRTIDIITSGPWIDSRAYSSMAEADSAAVSSGKTLLVSNVYTITTNTVYSSNMVVTDIGGFIVSSGTITFNGKFEVMPSDIQVFDTSGGGAVKFGTNSVQIVHPEWWGANGNDLVDDTNAIQSALNTAKDVDLGRGTYRISDTLSFYSPSARQKFYGQNPTETVLLWTQPTGTQFIKMHYGGTTLERMYIDGNGATGLAGIILADGTNPTGNTFFQTINDIYMINVPGIGINGTSSGGACANENTYKDVHVFGSSYGFVGNCPAHTFIHGEFKACSVFGMQAGANCKVQLYGTTFTGNKQDLELVDGSEVDGSSVWFENSGATGDWGGTVYGAPIAMSGFGGKVYLNIMGAHLHTYTSSTYFVDLSSATSGQFNMVGAYSVPTGTVAPYSFNNNINVTPNINSNIHGNTNIGTISGTYNNFNSTKMMATPFTSVTGTSGAWGPVVQVVPSNGFSTMIPYSMKVSWSGSFSAGESITVVGDIYGMDFLSTKQLVVSGITSTWTSPYYVPQSSIAELWMNGTYPRALNVYSSTTASITTGVTVTVTPFMTAH